MAPMVILPDQLLWEVLDRITKTSDRNSVSLACKRLYEVDREQREYLRVGCGLHPANEALLSLCNRFHNLKKVEIVYSGWMSRLGKQLDNDGVRVISEYCRSIVDLTLSYCIYITDVGLGHLASCSTLTALKLNFTPGITGCGLLSVAVGCKNLSTLHLCRCLNVKSVEWLEYLGKLETLEDLSIINCRGIGEADLIKLGPGWRSLTRLQFEVDANYRYMKVHNQFAMDRWKKCVPCDSLEEISLVNCLISPERGLSCVFGKCKALKKLYLDMCIGIRDCDIVRLAESSNDLKYISLRVPSVYSLPVPRLINDSLILTDESLKAVALNCPTLESVKISFSDGEFPCFSSFTLSGIVSLVQMCPVRTLSLDHVYPFNDIGMEALCSAVYLETLELVKCQEITDDGLQSIAHFPRLSVLRLSKCLGVTDEGLKSLVGLDKLEILTVEDCPQLSERGIQGAAKIVSFKQDLSWMF